MVNVCVLRNTEVSEICDFAMGPTTFHILIQEPSKMSLLLKCVLGICQRWCCVHVEMNSRERVQSGRIIFGDSGDFVT